MLTTFSTSKASEVLRSARVLGACIFASGLLLSACDEDKEEYVPASPKMQQLREKAGLHPPDKQPAGAAQGAGGQLTEDSKELREKAGLHPVSGEDYAKTPEELRERLDLHPDPDEPPETEAEMRERMDLHPEPDDSEK